MKEFNLYTLCYIERGGKYLMLHRTKKEGDINKDKWIGVGGKLERGESPEDCVLREVREETGLIMTDYRLRGILTFVFDGAGYTEYGFLYTCADYEGEVDYGCDEGELCWVDKAELLSYPIWEGDKIFLRLLDERDSVFSLKLVYSGDKLESSCLDGEKNAKKVEKST